MVGRRRGAKSVCLPLGSLLDNLRQPFLQSSGFLRCACFLELETDASSAVVKAAKLVPSRSYPSKEKSAIAPFRCARSRRELDEVQTSCHQCKRDLAQLHL